VRGLGVARAGAGRGAVRPGAEGGQAVAQARHCAGGGQQRAQGPDQRGGGERHGPGGRQPPAAGQRQRAARECSRHLGVCGSELPVRSERRAGAVCTIALLRDPLANLDACARTQLPAARWCREVSGGRISGAHARQGCTLDRMMAAPALRMSCGIERICAGPRQRQGLARLPDQQRWQEPPNLATGPGAGARERPRPERLSKLSNGPSPKRGRRRRDRTLSAIQKTHQSPPLLRLAQLRPELSGKQHAPAAMAPPATSCQTI
jgi:hypothetical protein